MRFGWLDLILAALASTVLTLLAMWMRDEFRTWRIHASMALKNRRGPTRGRRFVD